jgi:diguanylate cyclase (GGDEF)-like protein
VHHEYCKVFHYDQSGITSALALLELSPEDSHLAESLQENIIKPNLRAIIDTFYDEYLLVHERFRKILGNKDRIPNLKISQAKYLLSFGMDFNTLDYFENRLRVGVAHQRVGLGLSLYNFAYRKLRELILSYIPEGNDDELMQLRRFIDKIIALDMSLAIASYHGGSQTKLESSVEHLKHIQSQLEKKANTDTLTHLNSRDATLKLLEQALQESQQADKSIIVMMIDIDDLGSINDQYGHLIGDHVMREVAGRIEKTVPSLDKIGRYGGDEFIIIARSVTLSQALSLAEQVRSAIDTMQIPLKDNSLRVTASLGVCQSTKEDSIASIIQRVDRAMFSAKKAGGNRVMSCQKFTI